MSRTVVLVHGLWYGPTSFHLLKHRLERLGFRCRRFSYPTVRRTGHSNARSLREFVDSLDGVSPDLVGHSLGGLVIVRMLEQFTGLRCGRIVLLGTPLCGSVVARRLVGWPWTKGLIGHSEALLTAGIERLPPGRQAGVIAGTKSLGMGRVLARLERPNDGTVSVAETGLPGLADRIELPVSHTGLVLSARVADQIAAFLSDGRFRLGRLP